MGLSIEGGGERECPCLTVNAECAWREGEGERVQTIEAVDASTYLSQADGTL